MDATVASVSSRCSTCFYIQWMLLVVIQLVLHPMDATVASVAVDFPLILHLIDATVTVLAVVFHSVLHPLCLDATVLSVHVALRSGDDL